MNSSSLEMAEKKSGVTWQRPVVTAIATIGCTVLAIYAVILAPVGPFPGVSALYFAAAIYVPLSLWLGLWGCLAGYISQLLVGLLTTPFGSWSVL